MNNTVCDSPFEVTVAKLRGVRDGPYWGASSDAGEFGPVPGEGRIEYAPQTVPEGAE